MNVHRQMYVPAAVIGLAILLYAGCQLAEEPSESGAHAYDVEGLFRGLVLGHGPVAQRVPEIRDHVGLDATPLTQDQRTQVLALFDEIIVALDTHDPEFLAWFETEIASGDHYRVAEALHEGRKAMMNALPHTSVGALPSEVAGELDEELTIVLGAAVHVAVAVHVWAAVHNMVAISAIGWRYVISYTEVGEGPHVNRDILADKMVDSIVRHVSTPMQEVR